MVTSKTTTKCEVCEREYESTDPNQAHFLANRCELQGIPMPLEVGDVFVDRWGDDYNILLNSNPENYDENHNPIMLFHTVLKNEDYPLFRQNIKVSYSGDSLMEGGKRISDEEIADLVQTNLKFREIYGKIIHDYEMNCKFDESLVELSYLNKPLRTFAWSEEAKGDLCRMGFSDEHFGGLSGIVSDLASKARDFYEHSLIGYPDVTIPEIEGVLSSRGLGFAEG